MYKFSAIFIFSLIFLFVACSTTKNDTLLDNELNNLLENKDFFKFRSELVKSHNKLSEDRLLYYNAHCENIFNNSKLSNEYIEKLMNTYRNKLNDTLITNLLSLKASIRPPISIQICIG